MKKAIMKLHNARIGPCHEPVCKNAPKIIGVLQGIATIPPGTQCNTEIANQLMIVRIGIVNTNGKKNVVFNNIG